MVLDAIATGKFDKDAILKLVEAKPGLEHHNPTEDDSTPAMLSALQRKTVREALVNKLLPRDTRDRAHRKDEGSLNGAISFLELGKLMNAGWKDCDEAAKEICKCAHDMSPLRNFYFASFLIHPPPPIPYTHSQSRS